LLDADQMIAEAQERAGIADPEPRFHVNLERLVESLNRDGRFSTRGEADARQGLVDRQTDRLEGLKWLARHPEIADVPIVDPVFLTGLPRSGTTYFQYLFDHDRRFRLIRTWETVMPNPPPGADPESVARRKAIEEEGIDRLRPEVEGFDALHLIDKDGPQECGTFLDQTGSTAGYFNLYDCPDYFDWLMGGLDLEAAYRVHKRQLQLLQWQLPQPRWALKFPNHVIAMDAIMAVYPDARFVMTHRDPTQVLASIAKLTFSLRGAGEAAPVDPHRVGRQMLDFIKRHIDRIMAFCTGPHANRVTHVDYYRVAADPSAVLDEVHAGIGTDMPDDVRESIAAWRRDNPQGKRGENKYTLEQFGIDRDEARELYSVYIRHFDIPSEAEGKARSRAAA
jgi:hypothetical protein